MVGQNILKNVVLDLGGVLVDIDPAKTLNAMMMLIDPKTSLKPDWAELNNVVHAMEVGKWSQEEFILKMKEVCRPNVAEAEIRDAWCVMLLHFPSLRVDMVRLLSDRYRVFLLSNTNEIHVNYFEQQFEQRYGFSMHCLFEKVFYSNKIGCRKPDAEAFLHVLNNAGLNPTETVMVDDRLDNCQGAEAVGMRYINVPENTGLEAVVDQLINVY
jgi:glucose-1-phosphatase